MDAQINQVLKFHNAQYMVTYKNTYYGHLSTQMYNAPFAPLVKLTHGPISYLNTQICTSMAYTSPYNNKAIHDITSISLFSNSLDVTHSLMQAYKTIDLVTILLPHGSSHVSIAPHIADISLSIDPT